MRLIDSTLHRCLPGLGIGRRWLKERLSELEIKIPLVDACLQELVSEAEAATWRALAERLEPSVRYLNEFKRELEVRADLVRQWTASDAALTGAPEATHAFVRIARKYALPRPWRLSEPVAAINLRARPSYFRWASDQRPIGSSLDPA